MKDHHLMRAWDGERFWKRTPHTKWLCPIEGAEPGRNYERDQLSMAEYELCSGCKDQEGKLIYEGDVVRYEDDGLKTGKVVCFDGAFGFICSYMHNHALFSFRENQLEIIGNIHENPDLLEQNS